MTVIIELADGAIKEYGTVLRFNDKDYFTICGQDVGKNLEGCNHLACALRAVKQDDYHYPEKGFYDMLIAAGVLIFMFGLAPFDILWRFIALAIGIYVIFWGSVQKKETRNKIEAELREFDKYKTIGGVPGRLV